MQNFPEGISPSTGLGRSLKHPFLAEDNLKRLTDLYGTGIHRILNGAQTTGDLGRHFGAGLYEAEIAYLEAFEWAASTEDVLLRRTKLGLHMTPAEIEAVRERFRGGTA
jgi:glycerol-3-phosphate dehydrogenase